MTIHPTAVVDPAARLGADVEIGPYAVVGAGVEVGDRCRIGPHAVLEGPLVLGEECVVGFGTGLGQMPQVKGNTGPFGSLRIGRRNVIREHVTVHRAMHPDGETTVGDDGFFMVGAHVAHDCVLGDHVILCNLVSLGGHVTVGDRAYLGGNASVGQFRRVGELATLGGATGLDGDVPPFCLAVGARNPDLHGLNLVGLKRAGVDAAGRAALKAAYRVLFRGTGPWRERLERVEVTTPEVGRLVAFLRAPTKFRILGVRGDG